MWESRNKIQHSEDSIQNQQEQRPIYCQIHQAYDRGAMDFPSDAQHLFRKPLAARLHQSLSDNTKWLRLVNRHHNQAELRHQSTLEQRRRFRASFQTKGGSVQL
jgi:hypothetical protein